MQLVKSFIPGYLALLLLVGGLAHAQQLLADDEPKPEAPPAPVKEVLDVYLKAVAAKDLKAMTALADIPWLDRDRQVVRDRAKLAKAVQRVAKQLPKGEGERKVEAFPYKKMRGRIQDEVERKLMDEMVGDDGWLVFVENDGYPLSARTLLFHVKDGKAVVTGGPLKQNQITPTNRIPEAVERLFDKAETFDLYSLDPERKLDKDGNVAEVQGRFPRLAGTRQNRSEGRRRPEAIG
jgi:hypothetical protein